MSHELPQHLESPLNDCWEKRDEEDLVSPHLHKHEVAWSREGMISEIT